jgi:acetyltransferase
MRFSYFVAHLPEISEVDINPLLVTPQDVLALDARIVVNRQALGQHIRPYSHLAIGPYPEELAHTAQLPDGTTVLLRPIRPEDEQSWKRLLESSSPESIRQRFRYLFKSATHQMAARFCFIDYDREIALAAETTGDGRQIMGVGRLIADADHEEAEFAVMVGDPWQGRGLGALLMDECLSICRRWGIRRVTAETAPDNFRMLGMFQRRGFALDRSVAADVVVATLEMPPEA